MEHKIQAPGRYPASLLMHDDQNAIIWRRSGYSLFLYILLNGVCAGILYTVICHVPTIAH
jgi:hypothetical protein